MPALPARRPWRPLLLLAGAFLAFGLNVWSYSTRNYVPPYAVFFGPFLLAFGIGSLLRPALLDPSASPSAAVVALRATLGFGALLVSVLLYSFVWVPR